MMVTSLPSVADKLESANYLANGEEAEAFGEDDAARDKVRYVQAAYRLEECGLRDDLEELARRLDGFPCVPKVALEG